MALNFALLCFLFNHFHGWHLFIYLFGCVGSVAACRIFRCGASSSLQHTGISLVVACRFSLSSCGAQAPEGLGFVVCSRGASLAEALELSSCSVRAYLPRGMWDLSSPTRD